MSYTEIYRISKVGNTKLVAEIRNSHRGAMSVWTILEDRYLPPFVRYGQKMTRMITDTESQAVWDLANDSRLTEPERIALISTFDNVACYKKDFGRLCSAFREFIGNTSLPEQADVIEKLANDKNAIGVCWNQTSVNSDIPEKNVNDKVWDLFEHPHLLNQNNWIVKH
jgi:hypothetical protein